jgi:integrase/recombinase XerD
MTLDKAILNFLAHCRYERNLSANSIKAYEKDLAQFTATLTTSAASLDIGTVDRNHLRQYIVNLNAKYKPRSIKRKIATLKVFFSFLEREDCIHASPFRKMRLTLDRARSLPRTIPLESVRMLLASAHAVRQHCETHRQHREAVRDVAVLELLFASGMRVCELCKLTPRDIDLERGQIRILGKGKRERIVPVCSAESLDALRSYVAEYTDHLGDGQAFFLNRNLRPLSDQSVRRIIRKHCDAAGLDASITPHMFRHTIATMLLENGVDIRNIQCFLGHSSLSVTEIYTHVSQTSQRQAIALKHPRDGLLGDES